MKTKEENVTLRKPTKSAWGFKANMRLLIMVFAFILSSTSVFAHCDSYDGPVIKDALKALDQNNVELVLKWIEPQQEKEIISMFNKTYQLRSGNKEVYAIVEKHFLENLVRLHRETEGAPYTGLKPAGSMTTLVEMADNSIADENVEVVIKTVNNHLEEMLRVRYAEVVKRSITKDSSVEEGRAYVVAYVQYTHTLEALEHLLHAPESHGDGNHAGHH
ncbi:DUF6448 family protein [Mariniflexile ostreae]|uniref:DUF6448 family protein n=1 Tax=Mariniflexile ostreae TaxID=1520892 RepID=A0ABV5F8J8_9FLAO